MPTLDAVLPANLARARAVCEATMLDSCVVVRDAEGAADDTLNESTGALAPPSPDTTTIYSGPLCFKPTGLREAEGADGGRLVVAKYYEAKLPVNAASGAIRNGDVLTLTACGQDPTFVGRSFRVSVVEGRTLAVQRHLRLEDRT